MIVVACSLCVCVALGIIGPVMAAWEPGEPVVTYGHGPGGPTKGPGGERIPLTDAWLVQLKDGGFNTVWANTPEELDLVAKHGLRAIYFLDPDTMKCGGDPNDPAFVEWLAERIDRVKGHSALYVYALYDEPPTGDFARLARLKEWVRRRDPRHAAWINLLGVYCKNEQLGTKGERLRAYWEYLRLFGETVRPDFITYDHYQFRTDGDTKDYHLNLQMARQSAAMQGIPFWNGVQACTWVPGDAPSPKSPRIPGVDEMRYLVYTTAAYGAQGIYYYVYCAHGHFGAIVEADGTPGEKYEALKTPNREFVSIVRELSPLRFIGAYVQGVCPFGVTPYGETALLKIAPETTTSELQPLAELTDTTLVTRFDAPGKPTHLMVVNCDYRKDRTLHVEAPSVTERFDALKRTWSSVGVAFDLVLMRGSGVLLRLP